MEKIMQIIVGLFGGTKFYKQIKAITDCYFLFFDFVIKPNWSEDVRECQTLNGNVSVTSIDEI